MRWTLVVLALVAAACNPIQTAFPTAPTAPPATAKSVVYAIELQAPRAPDFASGAGVIGVRTRDVSGDLVGADVSCTTTSGLLFPARFDSTFRPTIELVSTTVPARVRCASGDIEASIHVDMSAWGVDLGVQEYDPSGPRAGETRVLLLPRQRIAGVEAVRLAIAWGDGSSDVSPFTPPSNPAQFRHRYRASGFHLATARIEWPGGAVDRRLTVFGGPPGSQP